MKLYCVDILWFCLNPCLHFYLCRCFLCKCFVCKWILMLTWCLKCYFKYLYFYIWCNDELFVYCIYMFSNLSHGLKCCTIIHFAKSYLYTCIVWCFQIIVSLHFVFTFVTSILLSTKPQKQYLIYEVPKQCYPVV